LRSQFIYCVCFGIALSLATGAALADPALKQLAGPNPEYQLTADTLATWVLDANPGLAAIQAAADAAAFRIDPAGSLDDPMLGYGVAPLTANDDRSLNQKFDISQKIPWPGTLAARESAARYDALAADRDVDALQLRVIEQAKAAYAEWWFVHSALEIHHATQALLDELIATAETRYAAGLALKQDVLHAKIARSDLDNHLLRLNTLRQVVQARINALLNRSPDAPLPAAAEITFHGAPPALATLQDQALTRHPDLAGLDARISASESRITLAEKAFYPDFQVGFGYNGLWDNTDQRPIVAVSINVPLDRSKRRAELSRAQAEKRRTAFSLTERRNNLLAELAQAHAKLSEAQSAVLLYQERLVPLADEYLEAAVADYQSGSGTFLIVITAKQRKLDTELAMARARADYARRLAELDRRAGGSIDAAGITLPGEH